MLLSTGNTSYKINVNSNAKPEAHGRRPTNGLLVFDAPAADKICHFIKALAPETETIPKLSATCIQIMHPKQLTTNLKVSVQ